MHKKNKTEDIKAPSMIKGGVVGRDYDNDAFLVKIKLSYDEFCMFREWWRNTCYHREMKFYELNNEKKKNSDK